MYVFIYIHRYNIDIILLTQKNIYKNICKKIYENNKENFFSLAFLFSDQNQLFLSFIGAGMSLQCSTVKTNNINKFEAMPTIAEHSQSCPTPQLAEQCVNFVVAEMSVSLFFLNFWKDLGGKCISF